MQVRLLDPNSTPPDENGQTSGDPSLPTLDPAVIARVKAQDAKDGGTRKTFWVDSEWSDPSEPVRVPPTPQTFSRERHRPNHDLGWSVAIRATVL
jgi:hypothetical protein